MTTKDDIKRFISFLTMKGDVKSQLDFGLKIGYKSSSSISQALSKDPIVPETIHRIISVFPEFETWDKDEINEVNPADLPSNGRLIEKPFTKQLIKLPIKAQLGLKDADFPEVYLDQLEKYEIQTEDNWHGRYFDIESEGESMVCDDPEKAIFPGDEIRVREIRWDLYANSKLHINDYPEFAFFHRFKGICVKHVLEHNVQERKVLLHSYNPDKERYPDEWVSLNDCYIVANVVSITRIRGFKRKIDKLNKL